MTSHEPIEAEPGATAASPDKGPALPTPGVDQYHVDPALPAAGQAEHHDQAERQPKHRAPRRRRSGPSRGRSARSCGPTTTSRSPCWRSCSR
ncbi:hypothetical protein ACFQZ4_28195 [Catellatospora coxensis]